MFGHTNLSREVTRWVTRYVLFGREGRCCVGKAVAAVPHHLGSSVLLPKEGGLWPWERCAGERCGAACEHLVLLQRLCVCFEVAVRSATTCLDKRIS